MNHAEFEAEIGVPADFRQIGYLFLLTHPEQVADFQDQLRMWHRLGLDEARWVTPIEARDLSPVLQVDDVLGGTFCPSDGIASPNDVTFGYARAARRHGARLREGIAVTGMDVAAGRIAGVRTSADNVATKVIFNCAGPWAAEVGRMAGIDVPVLPYRRQIFVTDRFPKVPRTNPRPSTSQPHSTSILRGMASYSG